MVSGSIVDVYLLFRTESGIALTLDQKLSLDTQLKAEQMELQHNCSLEKLIQIENEEMISEIREANKLVEDFKIGKILTVNTVIKGKSGF